MTLPTLRGRLAVPVVALALVAGLGGSVAYMLNSVTNAETGALVSARPAVQGGGGFGGLGGFAAPGRVAPGRCPPRSRSS